MTIRIPCGSDYASDWRSRWRDVPLLSMRECSFMWNSGTSSSSRNMQEMSVR